MMKQLASVSKLSLWLLILLVRSPLVAPLSPSCAYIAVFIFRYETSLRDTTSAISTLNLALCPFYPPCCNQNLFDQIIASNNQSLWWSMIWIYRRILNVIWLHMHPTIIRRRIKVTMKPGSKWSIMCSNIITLMWKTNRLLLMFWWWSHILDFTWLLLLLLSSSLLIIFGQEFLKTRSYLVFGGTLRFTGCTGETSLGTGQTRMPGNRHFNC